MSRGLLWEIAVVATSEEAEAVAELLTKAIKRPAAVYTDAKTGVARVSVYCEKRSEWTPRKLAEVSPGLKRIQAAMGGKRAGRILVRQVAREDWAESWKRHFKCLEIGTRLLIKPSWIMRGPRNGQAVVVLDPGLSFGTGQHPTTAFCLRELVRHQNAGPAPSFWDIGTGSGILAIAAAKLGFAPVWAMDNDPESVRAAGQNARVNGVLAKIKLGSADLRELPKRRREKFDLICANLVADVLVREQERIVCRLRVGSRLVLAGILKGEFGEVRNAYERAGLRLARSRVEGEWQAGVFYLPGTGESPPREGRRQ